MEDLDGITAGMLVHGTNGGLGVVAAVEDMDVDGGHGQVLLVRSADGLRLYRLPAMLVRRLKHEDDRSVVVVDSAVEDLDPYIVERAAPTLSASGSAVPDAAVAPESTDIMARSISQREAQARGAAGTFAAAGDRPAEEWSPGPGEDTTLRIPLAAEELTADTQPVRLGTIHVHKGVETTMQTISVPVYSEEAIVERIPPDQYDEKEPRDPDEIIIPVIEEKLVYEKRAVIKEYIRIRKQRHEQTQDVSGEIRREYVEVKEEQRADADANAAPLFRVARDVRPS